jgi:hypothetical protein|tara:strand:- start:726 stop:962 length:237 start_codon:yes stop_codon:yes gene_type:complete
MVATPVGLSLSRPGANAIFKNNQNSPTRIIFDLSLDFEAIPKAGAKIVGNFTSSFANQHGVANVAKIISKAAFELKAC